MILQKSKDDEDKNEDNGNDDKKKTVWCGTISRYLSIASSSCIKTAEQPNT